MLLAWQEPESLQQHSFEGQPAWPGLDAAEKKTPRIVSAICRAGSNAHSYGRAAIVVPDRATDDAW